MPLPFHNLDLFSVGVAITSIGILGFLVYVNDRTNATNRSFFALSLTIICWSIANYLNYQSGSSTIVLWILRFLMFTSVIFAFALFRFLYIFPHKEVAFPAWYRRGVIPAALLVSVLSLSPFVFSRTVGAVTAGTVAAVQVGPGIFLFAVAVLFFDVGGIFFFVRHMRLSVPAQKPQYQTVLMGLSITLALILILDFILPAFLHRYQFIPLGALFLLPFAAFTAYAIYRHHLFNLRVAATAFLGFMVSIFTFVNVAYSASLGEIAVNVTAFIIVLLGSIQIVRSTVNLQIAEEELEEANCQQESLLHFISHEIKGYLTKSEAAFASIIEGDYGQTSTELKGMTTAALGEVRKGVSTVMGILDAANLKKGTVTFTKKPFDMVRAVADVVESLQPDAKARSLTLTYSSATPSLIVDGDEEKIVKHVIRNLIDNAVKYTEKGSVAVSVGQDGYWVRFVVADTGIGITPEDMRHLFTEGGRGKNSTKVNVNSTGYGLFIAKQIVEAHGGSIKVISSGEGKGSQFTVRLPLAHPLKTIAAEGAK